ncbi:unnamed protein product [Rhizophagus irregularis]|nr:unnamed protein product [Rhizophagus irregularis]CAB4417044.1 unnamed protein product [Rhizophagus irregularis]
MMSHNNQFSWRLNTRLRITIFLLSIFLLLTYQIFTVDNDDLDKPEQWWSNTSNSLESIDTDITNFTELTDVNDTTDTNDITDTINNNYIGKIVEINNDITETGKAVDTGDLNNTQSTNKIDFLDVINKVSYLPKIQSDPINFFETPEEKALRESRRESVKQGFLHAWNGYVNYAWGSDELLPITNSSSNNFNGWGATMVDALDTMWIMDLKDEFKSATNYIANVDFTWSKNDISIFETTIRYLGGLLSAYELSGDEMLLQKAKDLGEAMIPAFNSPTGIPYNTWNLTKGLTANGYQPYSSMGILSQAGTLLLEYTKLAQLTGISSYFDKVQLVTDVLDKAKKSIPGFYPLFVSQTSGQFINDDINFGGMGDSFYEYLIKEYIYIGGAIDQYRRMYEESIDSMSKYLIKKGQVKAYPDLLFLGSYSHGSFVARMEHLACFVPGMLAIGSKTLDRPKDLELAIELAETCFWAYNSTTTGIGPETFSFFVKGEPIDKNKLKLLTTQWNNKLLPYGVYQMNGNYLLRPETIESLFILYRVTGDKSYQEKGWEIWQAIETWCKTQTAYSGLRNVAGPNIVQNDNMESFFFAETLKYLYLLFSEPDVISLDNYVFNTESHPFLRMLPNYN